jgi:predicted choloylglycine hydrolase
MIARNFDYLPLVQPYYVVRECRPKGKLGSFEFTGAPLAGAVDGMNEKGLCVTYDYAFSTDSAAAPTAPISMAISGALEHCGTVAEAADWIASKPRWGGGLLMLADAAGDIASLELTPTRSHLRRPASGEDVIFHTNAFCSAKMREVQVPDDAVFTDVAPEPLRGRRLHLSSELRDARFRQLLDAAGAIGRDELHAIMSDHGPTGVPGDNTLCVHGTYWYTTACLQFFPRAKRMRIAYTTACQAQFAEIEF